MQFYDIFMTENQLKDHIFETKSHFGILWHHIFDANEIYNLLKFHSCLFSGWVPIWVPTLYGNSDFYDLKAKASMQSIYITGKVI